MKGHHLHEMNILAAATLAIMWTAAFSVFAATLAPDTAHDDIPGDATLKEIVEGAGATEALEAEAKERKAADAALVSSLSDLSDALNEESKLQCDAINAVSSDLSDHAADVNNPHGVTAAQLGALTAESDPEWAAWTNATKLVLGNEAKVDDYWYQDAWGEVITNETENAVAIGIRAFANGCDSMAIGNGSVSSDGWQSLAVGSCAKSFYGGVAIGANASASSIGYTAVGAGAEAHSGTSIGWDVSTMNGGCLAAGMAVRSKSPNAIALGSWLLATNKNAIIIGTSPTRGFISTFEDDTFNITTPDPAHFYFAATNAATARSLQSYLDERVSPEEKKYPLFIIRLNEDSSAPKFSDIELKATTNNYATFESMTFFAGTAVNGLDSSDYGFTPDWCRIYVLSSKVDGDVRRWRRIRNTTGLGEYKPGDFAIIVDPAMFRRGQGDGWCSDQNEELTWSFVRLGSGAENDAEKDADGTSQLWRPIMPVKWYSKLPAWADQKEYDAAN